MISVGNLGQIFLCLYLFPFLFTLIKYVKETLDYFDIEVLATWRYDFRV